jgi:3-methylcrotonyl-CoA carboxylase alpha subunit
MAEDSVVEIARGTLRVNSGGKRETVYVAGTPTDRWAFWNGHVYHRKGDEPGAARRSSSARGAGAQALTAPMPARVIKVLVAPGDHVIDGAAVLILEAMKMELPIRAPGDSRVKAVHCHEGDLVQPDQVLVELE